MGTKGEGLAEGQIGVVQTEAEVGIGVNTVVGDGAIGAGRQPGENRGGEIQRRVGVVGDFVSLSERGTGFGNHLELSRF